MNAWTESAPTARQDRSGPGWNWLFYPAIALAVMAVAREWPLGDRLRQGLDWMESLGPWGAATFIGLSVTASMPFLPGSTLTLNAGATVGVAWGLVHVSIGSTLRATAGFLPGHHQVRDAIARRIGGTERFPAVDRALARLGSGDRTRPPTDRALYGLGVLAPPGATVGVTRTARRVLTHFSER